MFIEIIRPLDLYLLDKIFDPVATWLHKLSGTSNYSLARWFLLLGTGTMLAGILKLILEHGKPAGALYLIAILIEFIFAFHGFRTAQSLEAQYLNPRVDKLPPNLRDGKHLDVMSRRFFLFLILLVFFGECLGTIGDVAHIWTKHRLHEVIHWVSWFPVVCGFMFLGCTPRLRRPQVEKSPVKAPDMEPQTAG